MDIALGEEHDVPELLSALVRTAVDLVRDQQRRRILRNVVPDITGEVYWDSGIRLVKEPRKLDGYSAPESPETWHKLDDFFVFPLKVFSSGKEAFSHDLTTSGEWGDFLQWLESQSDVGTNYRKYQHELRSFAGWPLKARGKTVGVLCLYSKSQAVFDGLTRDIVRARISRTNLLLERHERTHQIRRLAEMYSAMASTKSLADQNDMDKTIFTLLTGLTHGNGFGFNRAIFLEREADYLLEKCSVGPKNKSEGEKLYRELLGGHNVPLIECLNKEPHLNLLPYGLPRIPLHQSPCEVQGFRIDGPNSLFRNICEILTCEEVFVLPINDGNSLSALVLLDNFLTGRTPSPEKMAVLKAVAADYSTLFGNHSIIRKLEEQAKKDDLLHVLSHRLKTDILGPYEVITRALEGDDTLLKKNLYSIATKLKNVNMVVSDLLRFSLIQSGNLRAHAKLVSCDVEDVVRKSMEDSFPPCSNQVELRVISKVPIICDENLLSHVLTNIFDNAANYSLDGTGIEVFIRRIETGQVLIQVVNAPREPVEKEDLSSWFDLFTRGQNGKYAKGTGLGLYIADHIMRLHNGTIGASCLSDGRVELKLGIPVCDF
ncbi:MAG: hypothetical protein HY912_09430 [Desulfomonile tiedjei]|uniref:Histidine kinase domain-containing protein n=1 Tax=Desulfomonile tiedjei TaxID=2358 RepID=A0A9D6Z3B5_9BACT|nr:hypothetical protein [Desulfomonile tiedjei]